FIGTKYQEGKQTRMVKTQKNGPGLYASLTFMGSWEDYSSVSRRIYMEMLPKYNLKRRNGVDIELFRFIGNTSIAEDNWFEVEYYIPVTY
ncbi:TPA: effector binding domain-containing protein, partial [Enterobacter hormaechei subsp. steigerwaltii]|nr:effector binding domain-containing protein [Enterobacter hormaechei subsp. steigerwaltii]